MSSLSNFNPKEKYDVFLSFRGEETRDTIISHLYAALLRKNVKTFVDHDKLKRGDEISPSLLNAIKGSVISVIVFSEGYASSSWCLRELEEILKCMKTRGQILIPFFYHVNPSDIRKQTGIFGDGFAKLEQHFKERSDVSQRWRAALTEVANISGWDSSVIRAEAVLLENVVSDILKRLSCLSSNKKNLVGVESSMEKIELLLSLGSGDFFGVGILGMGGIGKSTLASLIYHKISKQFESYCFITFSGRRGELTALRQEILSAITLQDKSSPNNELTSRKEKSARKKILIVFDDVRSSGQIKYLIGDLNWFGPGSRIIITTRDKQVLSHNGVNKIYLMEPLSRVEALQLFSRYAFQKNYLEEGYEEVSSKMIEYFNGVPLFLKIFGSFLFGKKKEEWEIALNMLTMTGLDYPYDILKICYNGLSDEEQKIFLNIAGFMKGENIDRVIKTLKAGNLSAERGLSILLFRSFIIQENHTITMHDILSGMGLGILREQGNKNGSPCSRL